MTAPFLLPEGRVQVSFSGGRTSAYMLQRLLDANGDVMRDEDRVQVVFANTGRERPETLDFVAEVGRRWQVSITWVEFRLGEPGQRFEVVGRQGASVEGEPFEALIQHGARGYLPNATSRHCTSDLKIRPARDYLRSLGWKHWTAAIGIRADEAHRSASQPKERWTVWRPLVDAGVTKHDVALFWRSQPFDLGLPNVNGNAALGNCDGCFLKAEATLAALARDEPERHAWWERMERIAATRAREPSGAVFDEARSRVSLRDFVERQGDWIFSEEAHAAGVLCQADGGECVG